MEEVQLSAGMKYRDNDGQEWRIVSIRDKFIIVIQLNITRRVMAEMILFKFFEKLALDEFVLVPEEQGRVLTLEGLSEREAAEFNKKKEFIIEVRNYYGPTYEEFCYRTEKPEFIKMYKKYGLSKNTAHRTLTKWLQSGFSDCSLLRKQITKTQSGSTYHKQEGAFEITSEVISAFDKAIDAYRKNRVLSMEEAYVYLVRQFFSYEQDGNIIALPKEKRPTLRQFTYYLHNVMDYRDLEIKRTSVREFNNDKRLLLGKASKLDSSMRPGYILEADAMEMDFNIVSSFDKEINIGRPILYMLVDVFSHAIVAFHVGLDNNSNLALTSLLMNLMDDRSEVLKTHNIKMDLSLWPDPFLPHEIRCDRGSDFTSEHFGKLCKDLSIERTLELGASGSLKGLIERSFGEFNSMIYPHLLHTGLIQKRYDSMHKKEACLTISDAYTIGAMFVAFKNSYPTVSRKLTADMMKKKVDKTPIAIWNYGIKRDGIPMAVTNANRLQKMYMLLPTDNARISREGVMYRGLCYINRLDEKLLAKMYLAPSRGHRKDAKGTPVNSMIIRYDPRSINNLYYDVKGELNVLTLVPSRNSSVRDMTWDEYDDYDKMDKALNAQARERILQLKIEKQEVMSEIVNTAMTKTFSNADNIPFNREVERNEVNFNNRFQKRVEKEFGIEDTDPIPEDTEVSDMFAAPETLPEESPRKKDTEEMEDSIYSSTCPEDLWI